MMIRPFLRQRAKTPANLASRPPRRRAAHATDLCAASGFPAISQPPAACDPAHAARLRSRMRPAPGYPRFLVFSTWLLLKEKARHTKAPRAFSRMVLQEVRFCCLHLPRTYGNSPLADDTNPNVRRCCYSSGVEHSLGKGEAESSNLSSSTIFLSPSVTAEMNPRYPSFFGIDKQQMTASAATSAALRRTEINVVAEVRI